MPKELTPESVLGQHEQVLLYGLPKTGKTFLALTAPDPIYVMCIGKENELKTRYSKQYIKNFSDRTIWFDALLEEFGEGGEMKDDPVGLDRVGEAFDIMLELHRKGETPDFKTIVIDNATVLEEYQMYKAMAAGWHLANQKDKTALIRMRNYGIIKPGDNDWGAAQSLMDKFVNYISKLPFHIVLVAHEYQEFERSDEGRKQVLKGVYPLFVGKQRTGIARAFDNVWRTSISGGGRTQQFMVQTVGDDKVVAGTRVGGVFDDSENATNGTQFNLTLAIEQFQAYPRSLLESENKRSVADSTRTVRG